MHSIYASSQNEQAIDEEFSIANQSKERNLCGGNRPLFLPTAQEYQCRI